MAGRLSRRTLLATGGAFAAGSALAGGRASAEPSVLYGDDFRRDTLSEYDVSFLPYEPTSGTPDGTFAGGAIYWSPEDEWVTVESPEGGVAVIEPPVGPPDTGHVHVRLDVVRNNAPTNQFAVRLVEDEDDWVELTAMGNGERFAIVDNAGSGLSATGQLGQQAVATGRHSADLFWSPTKRAVYVDGDFEASSEPDGTFDFTPRRIEFRNVQNDTRLRYWQLDDGIPPDDTFQDLETPSVTEGPRSTEFVTPADRPSDERTPVEDAPTGTGDRTVEDEPPGDERDWLGGLGSILVPLVGVPILGPLVLGGLLAVSRAIENTDD